jgi:hypothetical protein
VREGGGVAIAGVGGGIATVGWGPVARTVRVVGVLDGLTGAGRDAGRTCEERTSPRIAKARMATKTAIAP